MKAQQFLRFSCYRLIIYFHFVHIPACVYNLFLQFVFHQQNYQITQNLSLIHILTTAYPRTSFKVPYVHNLFQNGAATLSGIAEVCYRKQEKGEIPKGDIVFIMVSGDGGMDIGMGSALGTALRGHRLMIFEYDNGGYMNTGYQLSYSCLLYTSLQPH